MPLDQVQSLWDLTQWVASWAARLPLVQLLPRDLIDVLMVGTVAGLLLTVVALFTPIAVYVERKVCAHMQDRLGPMRVGWHGILQTLVDGVKLILKEQIIPRNADRLLFVLAPVLVFSASFAAFVVIPFSGRLIFADLSVGVLYIVALGSAVLVGTVMAGWSSNNKWALLGAMRTVAMVVSYEVPIGLSILPIVMLAGTLSTQSIVHAQAGHGILGWYAFQYPPFLFLAFWILYVGALAEVNRTPFDLAEAESELVAGFHTEYSGIRWAFFFLAEYSDMLLVSMLGTTLFLGGWLTPDTSRWIDWLVVYGGLAVITLYCARYLWWFYWQIGERLLAMVNIVFFVAALGLFSAVPGVAWFLLKSLSMVFLMIWLRWTLPRPRIDQLMYLCWKVLVPLSFVNFIAVGIWYVFGVQALGIAILGALVAIGFWGLVA